MKIFSPIIFALILILILELFLKFPFFFIWFLGIIVVLTFAFSFWLSSARKDWWKIALLPATINLLVSTYLIILTNHFVWQVLIIILGIINFIYWRFIFLYINNSPRYRFFSLENISFYLNFFNIFLLGSLLFGLRAFIALNYSLVFGLATGFLALIIYQGFWISKIEWKKYWLRGSLAWFILLEIFVALLLLPLDYNVTGLVWALNYYLVISLLYDDIKQQNNKRKIKFYLIVFFLAVFFLFLTARWI